MNVDWEALFDDFDNNQQDEVLVLEENDAVIGFLLFREDALTHWFFDEPFIFIREFWVDASKRNKGIGTQLLQAVESIAVNRGLHRCILTTDSAQAFYINRGYQRSLGYNAKNKDEVFVKVIETEA